MKRGWLIVLLLSLGLNLGLGLNALRGPLPAPEPLPGLQADDGLETTADHAQVERFLRRRLHRMSERLGLSQDQRTALWELHLADGREIIMRRRVLQRAREDLQHLFDAPAPDLVDIQAAQHRISALQASLDSLVAGVVFRERAILTPEQRQAYRGFFGPGHEGHPGRRGHLERRRGDGKGKAEDP